MPRQRVIIYFQYTAQRAGLVRYVGKVAGELFEARTKIPYFQVVDSLVPSLGWVSLASCTARFSINFRRGTVARKLVSPSYRVPPPGALKDLVMSHGPCCPALSGFG